MSPAALAELEQLLEQKGSVSLDDTQLHELFDFRARKLVGMSGPEALVYIREGKSDSAADPAWTELMLFSTLMK